MTAIDWKAAYDHQATIIALAEGAIDQFYELLGGMDWESAKIAALRELSNGIDAYPDIVDLENTMQRKAYPFAPGERGDTGMVDGEDIPF
ncbi:MAG: hypothetical protein LC793_05935 [Thermomicrobia bacterium]|nr:hypothetical protein [Thermomicrobia bacterium]